MTNRDAYAQLEEGRLVAGYRVKSKLGSNELSASYLAEDTHTFTAGRQVVLKFPNPTLLEHRPTRLALLREALAPTRLRPRVGPEVLSVEVTDESELFLVREYVAGETLAERLAAAAALQEPLSPPFALAVTWQLARRLAEAHSVNVFHRALKPTNIVLLPRTEKPGGVTVRLLDFGSRELATPSMIAMFDCNVNPKKAVPRDEMPYRYDAPNHRAVESGLEPPTASEDVYSLGVILFEMLGGKQPDVRAFVEEQKTLSRPEDELARLAPALPLGVPVLLERMMSPDAEERPAMAEVQDALAGILDLPPSRRRSTSKAIPALPKPRASRSALPAASAPDRADPPAAFTASVPPDSAPAAQTSSPPVHAVRPALAASPAPPSAGPADKTEALPRAARPTPPAIRPAVVTAVAAVALLALLLATAAIFIALRQSSTHGATSAPASSTS